MKKMLMAVVMCFSLAVQAQIKWLSMGEALELQKKNPKKIMIDFYATWCGPCKMMDANTFSNKELASYVEKNFYPVKFNGESDEEFEFQGKTYANEGLKEGKKRSMHGFAQYMQIRAYPTLMFLDEELTPIAPISGYMKPTELEPYLNIFATDFYKEIKTRKQWDDFLANFKPEFKDKE